MDIQSKIEQQLSEAFNPYFLIVNNDSHLHAGLATESHFKVTLVTCYFEGQKPVDRQRSVYRSLNTIMQKIHALQLHTFTPKEWQEKNQTIPSSSVCAGAKVNT